VNSNVVTWSMPHTEMPSMVYSVSVEGTPIPAWLARVREAINMPADAGWTSMLGGPTEWCSFVRFDAGYPVTVRVTVLRPFSAAEILPRSAGIPTEVDGNAVTFRLDGPHHLTLCLDGCDEHPLHLFCREIETDRPDPTDENVIYFGPGEHWVHSIRVKSGQTIYIDGDAVLRAILPEGAQGKRGGVLNLTGYGHPVIDVDGVEDVRIFGRGIIDGGCLPHPAKNLVRVNQSRGVRIEGLTLRNSPNWHLPICSSEDVIVEDLVGLSGRLNSDGINCVNSSRVSVRRCFIRGHDDSFVVKTTQPDLPSTDILYEDCVAWNDWGYAFGISYETRADIRDVVFRNCDVLFSRNWALGVHVADSGTIGPVLFEGINVYYPQTSIVPHMGRSSIKIAIVQDVWGKDDRRGHVRDITFRDIAIAGKDVPSVTIKGFDVDHCVEDVSFENLKVNGLPVVSSDDQQFHCNEHVRNINVWKGKAESGPRD